MPENILKENTFKSILKEIHLAEATFELHKTKGMKKAKNELANSYQNIYSEYTISEEEFKSRKSILLNVRNDYSSNFSPEVDIVFEFPLGISTSKSDTSISGILEYSSNIRNEIARWTQNQNDFIFNNTPNYIQKNWKKYINFN